MNVDEQGLIEMIEFTGMLVSAGNNLAQELRVMTDAARESGSELQEAEFFLQEWNQLIQREEKRNG